MRTSWLSCLLGGMGLLASAAAANATVYDFSYTFVDGSNENAGTITGSFTGTGPVSDIINISNASITMSLDSTLLSGPFYAWSYTPTSPNCEAASCYTLGGTLSIPVVVSNNGGSNFVFSTANTRGALAASTYFYIIQPWTNPGPGSTTVATQFASGGDPNKYIDTYNGQFVEANFRVEAVPEPSTWAMMILGFVGLGFVAYRRKWTPALSVA
jgi:hypothetical protein